MKDKRNLRNKLRLRTHMVWCAVGISVCLPEAHSVAQITVNGSSFAVREEVAALSESALSEGAKNSPTRTATLRKKIVNPAPFTRGRMPQIIAQLERQKSAAVTERAVILAMPRKIPASAAIPAVQKTQSISPVKNNASVVTSVTRENVPSRPDGTAQPGNKPSTKEVKPTNTASVTSGPNPEIEKLPSAGAMKAAVCHGPTISSVNGQAGGVIFTTDPSYNQYTIKGCGFGDQQGQAHLYGPFVARTVNLEIEFWSDTVILAAVDPNLSGETDQQGTVNLVIAPVGAPEVQTPGFSFYAVRESLLLPSFPLRWAHLAQDHDTVGRVVGTTFFSPANSGGTQVYPGADTGDCSGIFVSARNGGPSGWTLEVDRFECGRIGTGTDTFDLSQLPPSLELYAFQVNSQNPAPGDCGGTPYIDGNWNEAWTGSAIQITTQASTCHDSGTAGYTYYALDIWVLGPRGVPLPF